MPSSLERQIPELHPDLPCGWKEFKHLGHHLPPPGASSQRRNWKQQSQSPNQTLQCRMPESKAAATLQCLTHNSRLFGNQSIIFRFSLESLLQIKKKLKLLGLLHTNYGTVFCLLVARCHSNLNKTDNHYFVEDT